MVQTVIPPHKLCRQRDSLPHNTSRHMQIENHVAGELAQDNLQQRLLRQVKRDFLHIQRNRYTDGHEQRLPILHAAKILAKDSARALMRELSESAAADQGIAGTGYNDAIDELSVDIPVTDGDIVEAGGLRFRVIETPGHTKCSVSYYCAEEGLLIASETTGIAITPPDVLPCYIIGYQMTMDSIAKCAALAPQDMLVPHWGLLPAGTTGTFLANAAIEAEKLYNFILEGHDAGLDADGIVAKYRERYYTPEVARCQPEKAFLLNANALVPRMLKEAGRVE